MTFSNLFYLLLVSICSCMCKASDGETDFERFRAQVRVPQLRTIKLEQGSLRRQTFTILSLISPTGNVLDAIELTSEPVAEVELLSQKRDAALLFIKEYGNHTIGQVIEVTSGHLEILWETTAAGGIQYEDFGTFSEVLIGRRGPQIGIEEKIEKNLGRYFQEVWIIKNGRIKFFGVRKRRENISITKRSEIIEGAIAE